LRNVFRAHEKLPRAHEFVFSSFRIILFFLQRSLIRKRFLQATI